MLHRVGHDAFHRVFLVGGHVEDEFVVHLQQHLCPKPFGRQSTVCFYHCDFHNVGCTSLYGSVYGDALGIAAHGGVAAVDVGQGAAAAEYGLGKSAFVGGLDAFVDVFFYFWEGLEVVVDELCGFGSTDVHSFCEAEGCDAVDDAEIGCFGFGALVACHEVDGFFEYLGGGCGVDVLPFFKGCYHVFVAA